MFQRAYNSMKSLPLMHDIISSDEVPFSYEDESTQTQCSKQNFKLYKIPRYLEKVSYLFKKVYFHLVLTNNQLNYLQYSNIANKTLLFTVKIYVHKVINQSLYRNFRIMKIYVYIAKIGVIFIGVIFAKVFYI